MELFGIIRTGHSNIFNTKKALVDELTPSSIGVIIRNKYFSIGHWIVFGTFKSCSITKYWPYLVSLNCLKINYCFNVLHTLNKINMFIIWDTNFEVIICFTVNVFYIKFSWVLYAYFLMYFIISVAYILLIINPCKT